jgi:hypothetical protein
MYKGRPLGQKLQVELKLNTSYVFVLPGGGHLMLKQRHVHEPLQITYPGTCCVNPVRVIGACDNGAHVLVTCQLLDEHGDTHDPINGPQYGDGYEFQFGNLPTALSYKATVSGAGCVPTDTARFTVEDSCS